MATKTVDARGLSCPEPVLLARQAIKSLESGTIDVLVDTVTSRENVSRTAQSLGCTVEVTSQHDNSFVVHVQKGRHE
jgi:TusA-related sulfurtransferase